MPALNMKQTCSAEIPKWITAISLRERQHIMISRRKMERMLFATDFLRSFAARLLAGLAGLVTNGGVRDLNEVRPTGFQMFAGNVSVSHAYAHIFDFGGPVVVGGLEIRPGDLIHADRNGVQTIPLEIASEVPGVAHKIQQRRQKLVGLCRRREFSIEALLEGIQEPELQS